MVLGIKYKDAITFSPLKEPWLSLAIQIFFGIYVSFLSFVSSNTMNLFLKRALLLKDSNSAGKVKEDYHEKNE